MSRKGIRMDQNIKGRNAMDYDMAKASLSTLMAAIMMVCGRIIK